MDVELSEDERMLLKGRIDRLDVCREGDRLYLRVIDYKTGNTTMDLALLSEGLQLQLAVYLNAALDLERKRYRGCSVEPAGIYYYRIGDPLVEAPAGESQEERERELLKALSLDGLSRQEEEILFLLDQELGKSGRSEIIPVAFKKDGSLMKYSRVGGRRRFSGYLQVYRAESPRTGARDPGRKDGGCSLQDGKEHSLRLLPLPRSVRV